MKLKATIIAIVVITVLGLGAFFYVQNGQKKSDTKYFYRDEANKAGFDKADEWFTSSTDGYIQVSESQQDLSKPAVLIKLKDQQASIEALGLDKAREVTIGSKHLRQLDREVHVAQGPDLPDKIVTLTQLLWIDPAGRQIIFEITPWQKPEFDPGMEKIITTFKSL